MKPRLIYRLIAIMMLLVVLVVSFVGTMLILNIIRTYNRNFYEEIDELAERITFFQLENTETAELVNYLNHQEELNPLLTDRNFYILRGNTVIAGNSIGGVIQKSANLKRVLAGGRQSDLYLLGAALDYAMPLGGSGRVLYIVDQRGGLYRSIRTHATLFIHAFLIGTALTVALSVIFARRFLIPIQKLTQSATTMQRTGEFHQIAPASRDEVGELTRVFNEMGVRITKNIRYLQDLLRIIPKPLFTVNEKGTIVHTNEAFKLLFEKPPQKSLFLTGHENEDRYMIRVEDRYFCVYRCPLLMENGAEGALYLLDDITEAELQEAERKRFLANVSHELKTPLTVIKSYSETLQDGEVDPETTARFLQTIERSSDQMNAMVNQLLALAKAENEPHSAVEPLDLTAAAREVLDMMQIELQKKALRSRLNAPPARVLVCEADRVRRVMVNLLSNSVKYSNPGGVVTVSITDVPGGVELAVADEGIGIEKKHLPHLFDPFYRVDKARSRETGGTGLGLSIVHAAVTGMGGSVKVESTFGKGSVFTCFFPDKD